MPKNLFQDMVRAKHLRKKPAINNRRVEVERHLAVINTNTNINKTRPRYRLWIVAFACTIFLFFTLSYFFARATIIINPKVKDVVVKENLSAVKDSTTNALSFDLVVISGEQDKAIQTTITKRISQEATGQVMIYNNFNGALQKLAINTKLEGSNGKVYMTNTAITVPGKMTNGNPGSVQVGIHASVSGAEYNSAPLDFSILGFKGTSKYNKIFAKSINNGTITGGLQGIFPDISETDEASALSDLKTTLQTDLLKRATDQIPSGFILFKNAVFLNTDDNDVVDYADAEGTTLPLKLTGTFYGILLNENDLTNKIATDNITGYNGGDVYIPNIQNLTFTLSSKDNTSFADVQNINFDLSGPVQIVYKVDTNKLLTDLLDKSKKDFNQILLQYPSIDSANLSISPIWKFSIPDDSKDIKIIVNYPQ